MPASTPSGECFPYPLHSTSSRLPYWGIFLSRPLHTRTFVLFLAWQNVSFAPPACKPPIFRRSPLAADDDPIPNSDTPLTSSDGSALSPDISPRRTKTESKPVPDSYVACPSSCWEDSCGKLPHLVPLSGKDETSRAEPKSLSRSCGSTSRAEPKEESPLQEEIDSMRHALKRLVESLSPGGSIQALLRHQLHHRQPHQVGSRPADPPRSSTQHIRSDRRTGYQRSSERMELDLMEFFQKKIFIFFNPKIP